MADDRPMKSSFELAMERLKKQDAEAGIEVRAVTDAQKAAIAEVRNFYEAKLAEQQVLHQSADPQHLRSGRARRAGSAVPSRERASDV